MKVRSLLKVLILFVSAWLIGCGGGGGGGGGPRIYFLVRVELPGKDPINIELGEVVTFVLAGYEQGTGNRFVLTATSFSVIPNPDNVGTINNSGVLTTTSTGNARIRATWDGTPTPQDLNITVRPQNLARLTGIVRSMATNNPVANVYVAFYDSTNTEVGRAITLANGTFRALVPTNTTKMNLVDNLIPPGWYDIWNYRGLSYTSSPGVPNCHAVFVANPSQLQSNVTSNIPDPIFLRPSSDPPPPPPNGCQ